MALQRPRFMCCRTLHRRSKAACWSLVTASADSSAGNLSILSSELPASGKSLVPTTMPTRDNFMQVGSTSTVYVPAGMWFMAPYSPTTRVRFTRGVSYGVGSYLVEPNYSTTIPCRRGANQLH